MLDARQNYRIGMLWVEGPLTYVEQLCAKSFVDAGHEVKLYHYGEVQNVPEGVELVDGNEVLEIDRFIRHGRTGSFALFSDVFRYHLLKKNDRTIWADMDAYCLRPFESETGHFFGWESPHHINGGVLGLPPDSPALDNLLEMSEDEYGIPPWYSEQDKERLEARRVAGDPVHVADMPWGVWGPHAVTYHLHQTGEAEHALPRTGLYPVKFRDRRMMMRAAGREKLRAGIPDDAFSIHFYGRRLKAFLDYLGGRPEEGSLIDELLKKHNIDPDAAPIQPLTERKPSAQQSQSKLLNLSDLATKYGSDKSPKRHKYSELYQMLFQPYRQRKITFLEMGLLIGGPELGKDADRDTRDLPSVRMWLEYFPKAEVIGLDVSDFSWFEHERFRFIRCDMDDRVSMARASLEVGAPDIIIDDASHASHHQQNAFLALFPKLKPGGIYAIEDLRWQPDAYEKPGITKTAEMFQQFRKRGSFSHSDKQVAADFNDLKHEISGSFVFPSRFEKGGRDQLLVVHKR